MNDAVNKEVNYTEAEATTITLDCLGNFANLCQHKEIGEITTKVIINKYIDPDALQHSLFFIVDKIPFQHYNSVSPSQKFIILST